MDWSSIRSKKLSVDAKLHFFLNKIDYVSNVMLTDYQKMN